MYARHGLQFLTRAHQRLNVGRLPRLIVCSPDDFVTTLTVDKKQRAEDPQLPAEVTVRMINVLRSKKPVGIRNEIAARSMPGKETLPAPAWLTGELEGEPCGLS